MTLSRRAAAEFGGSLILAAVVIGSGIMGAQLASGDAATALLCNTLATAAILFVLISALGPVSGAHFNPVVTLAFAARGELGLVDALIFIAAQVLGCILGAALAHAMFELPLVQVATSVREGPALMLSEGVATFALVGCVILVRRARPDAVAGAVALTIAAGYWWTSSSSFANPAITVARALSDTFAGIRLQDVYGFMGAQFAGATLATVVCAWFYPDRVRADQALSTAAAARSVSNSGG